ncbi:MAG: alpha/beta hydrolase [Bacteroidota bacterium]
MQYTQWQRTAQYLDYEGHRIAYYQAGTGPKLTFIHGFPTSSHDWVRVWSRLQDQYSLLALDLLGFGQSSKPRPHSYNFTQQAHIVRAVWQHLGITQTTVIAHDYGSTVALELIAQQKEGDFTGASTVKAAHPLPQLQQVLLLNGGIVQGVYRPRIIQRLMASFLGPALGLVLGRGSLARNFRAIFGPQYPLTDAEIDDFWSAIEVSNGKWALPYIGRYLHERAARHRRWEAAIANPGVPLHHFWGLFDPISGQAMVDAMQDLNPQLQGQALDGVGHYPQWEKPEELAAYIRWMTGA